MFLALGQEKFLVGELVGFALLIFGTLVYNEILTLPSVFTYPLKEGELEKAKTLKFENESEKGETAATSSAADQEERQ